MCSRDRTKLGAETIHGTSYAYSSAFSLRMIFGLSYPCRRRSLLGVCFSHLPSRRLCTWRKRGQPFNLHVCSRFGKARSACSSRSETSHHAPHSVKPRTPNHVDSSANLTRPTIAGTVLRNAAKSKAVAPLKTVRGRCPFCIGCRLSRRCLVCRLWFRCSGFNRRLGVFVG